ncbi:NHL repeat-containing protein [Paenibacillus taihuensis]|uniref:NHL repeat-containing protein n=1 Tax=Paenibacillus taihuensis TaxID=1156355 RepID=A0A3D9QXN1_9BACL|nr:hypothetical protein [Paenibacillus taihuensis]REE69552.1 NHL repeat-containing protein [Paenibacillus taihuensis]
MGRKSIIIIPILVLVSMLAGAGAVFAQAPYPSYGIGPDKHLFRIQTPYMPVRVLGTKLYEKNETGMLTDASGLNNPNDIFIDGSDSIYVADNYNNRVVKINDEGLILQQFGTGEGKQKLKAPEGVYASDNGDVYVADTGNQRIAVYSADGHWLKEYKKPGDVSLKNVMFAPIRVSLDARGFLFVVLKGSNQGIAVLSPEGKFQGFFGRNKTEMTLIDKLKRKLYTQEQVETSSNQEAASVSDLFIGSDHYIYTCTLNVTEGQIKKLNTKGEDLFKDVDMKVSSRFIDASGGLSIGDITVDSNGIIYSFDRNSGLVLVYDNDGQVLAAFGTKLTGNNYIIGSFGVPVSIAVNSKGMIYVADQTYNGIHVFKPTEFMNKVLTATNLYNNGDYAKAKPYWEDLLKRNVFYYKAHLGLGGIYYENEQWAKSMEEMKIAENQQLFSDAYWQLRVIWIQRNLNAIAASFVLLAVIFYLLNKWKRGKLKRMKEEQP